MAEKTRDQWRRAVRRWSAVGLVAGLGTAVYVVLVVDQEDHSPLEVAADVLSFALMGAAFGLMLWASTYRYTFVQVWGWAASGLTAGLLVLLVGGGTGLLCLRGGCGGP